MHVLMTTTFFHIQSIRPRTAASPSIQSMSHITSRHGDNPFFLIVHFPVVLTGFFFETQ